MLRYLTLNEEFIHRTTNWSCKQMLSGVGIVELHWFTSLQIVEIIVSVFIPSYVW